MHALENKQNDVVIALYEELLQRGELLNAFKNLDDVRNSLFIILTFHFDLFSCLFFSLKTLTNINRLNSELYLNSLL